MNITLYNYPAGYEPIGTLSLKNSDGKMFYQKVPTKEMFDCEFKLMEISSGLKGIVLLKNLTIDNESGEIDKSRAINFYCNIPQEFLQDKKVLVTNKTYNSRVENYDIVLSLKQNRRIENVFTSRTVASELLVSWEDYQKLKFKTLDDIFSNKSRIKSDIVATKNRLKELSRNYESNFSLLMDLERDLITDKSSEVELNKLSWSWDVSEERIILTTKEITVNMSNKKYYLGYYTIIVNLKDKTVEDIFNEVLKVGGNNHPHVGSYVCLGSFELKIKEALVKLDLRVLEDILTVFLIKLNPKSMFGDSHINKWPWIEDNKLKYSSKYVCWLRTPPYEKVEVEYVADN